jgi:asparagine synthase (glutamine-hydrolysing)
MCGIAAIIRIDRDSTSRPSERISLTRQLEQSLDRIEHRGPDSRGVWICEDERLGENQNPPGIAHSSVDTCIAFGHVHLSIKDLSDAGTQPLSKQEGTVHVVVNGEFYEYDRNRAELSPTYNFQSRSDSELLIALYQRDGLNCFSHLRGEFSFVLYDSQRETLLAATDRFGIKPLFWTVAMVAC